LAVNDVGAFFREYDSRGEPWSFPGARYYRGNTLSQQAQTLIHEIGHFVPLARRTGVDTFPQRHKPNPQRGQFIEEEDQVSEVASEPIQPPHDKRVEASAVSVSYQLVE
jgi:hypothetical protein